MRCDLKLRYGVVCWIIGGHPVQVLSETGNIIVTGGTDAPSISSQPFTITAPNAICRPDLSYPHF